MTALKKGLLIASIIFATVVLYAAAVLLTAEIRITLKGSSLETIDIYGSYTEEGAQAEVSFPLFFGYTEKADVICGGKVQTDKVGEYMLEYKAKYLNKSVSVSRTVKLTDTVAPTLELEKTLIELDQPIATADEIQVKYKAFDNYDKDITAFVIKELDGNICRYSVKDSSGNTASAELKIIYIDTAKPKISLKGNNTVYMPINTEYKELGYTVTDNFDKDIASGVVVSSNVDMSKRGTYSVKYTATDEAGNTASVTRKVIVYGGDYNGEYDTVKPNQKVIYLTFDDGPGVYTERLLNILSEYNVKATFFVTNQFPKYQHLITRINSDGHTVALHTLTHKWSIYSSLDSYLKDFNAMNDIIEQRTGSKTRFFRFPGGTSNGQGNNYNRGIMVELSKYMLESGYSYFDWNVSSGDTYLTDSSSIISYLIEQVSKRKMSIVLAHDIKKATVEAIPGFIEYALKNGYTFKVIDDTTEPIRFNPKS